MSDDAREAHETDEREAAAAHDAAMIADLRAWRARVGAAEGDRWSARFTLGEIDAVLRAIDERDELKRAAAAMPDEREAPHRILRAACHRPYPHPEHPYGFGSECDGIPE
jgi:hypothetical protein